MGYIDLPSPIVHTWFLNSRPCVLEALLGLTQEELKDFAYLMNTQNPLGFGTYAMDCDQFFPVYALEISHRYFHQRFVSKDQRREFYKAGSFHIYERLKRLDVQRTLTNLDTQIKAFPDTTKLVFEIEEELLGIKKKFMRRRTILRSFFTRQVKPEWLSLSRIPVLPPDLRPVIEVGDGQLAAADLNKFYQDVIDKRNNLKLSLRDEGSLSCKARDDHRKLQVAVDNLFSNGVHKKDALKDHLGVLKRSLSDAIKGKKGRFRFNLLGKRVDYSGRSVIVVGPKLKIYQCGLPKELALLLFYPFLIAKYREQGIEPHLAKYKINNPSVAVWNLLEEIVKNKYILLNRAPTLHRLGFQGFQPILITGNAIQLHPLVCPGFNADFDGDQMAVHLPISLEAQNEARCLMLAGLQCLSTATGQPSIFPTQDMILGLYYLTLDTTSIKVPRRSKARSGNAPLPSQFAPPTEKAMGSLKQVAFDYEQDKLSVHDQVWLKWDEGLTSQINDPLPILVEVSRMGNSKIFYTRARCRKNPKGFLISQIIRMSVGRLLFNRVIQETIDMIKR